jgi:hypothetical protein
VQLGDAVTPPLLSVSLLERFEAALRSVRAPIVEHWAPGASDAEIDEALGPLGIDAPAEGRLWWQWHNGVRVGATASALQLVPRREPLAVASSAQVLARTSATLRKAGRDDLVQAQLLPLVSEKPFIYLSVWR